jgi:hypothetical protein
MSVYSIDYYYCEKTASVNRNIYNLNKLMLLFWIVFGKYTVLALNRHSERRLPVINIDEQRVHAKNPNLVNSLFLPMDSSLIKLN